MYKICPRTLALSIDHPRISLVNTCLLAYCTYVQEYVYLCVHVHIMSCMCKYIIAPLLDINWKYTYIYIYNYMYLCCMPAPSIHAPVVGRRVWTPRTRNLGAVKSPRRRFLNKAVEAFCPLLAINWRKLLAWAVGVSKISYMSYNWQNAN